MKLVMFERVALCRDVPEAGLHAGDTGVLVEWLPPDGVAIEFFNATGETEAVELLAASDVRALSGQDMPSVRRIDRSGRQLTPSQRGHDGLESLDATA